MMRWIFAAALVLVQAKDNPEYAWWKDCKAGSWVKFRMEGEFAGQKIEGEQTHTLLELSAEKAVVDRKGSMKVGASPPVAMDKKDEVKAKAEEEYQISKEGEEEIEIAGKKLKCRWIDAVQTKGGEKAELKFWLSKDVPGGVVKGEVRPSAAPGVMKLVATAWEKK
jgi:hypothetical protein